MGNDNKKKEAQITKVCPYCKSDINIEATRCPRCTSNLTEKAENIGENLENA